MNNEVKICGVYFGQADIVETEIGDRVFEETMPDDTLIRFHKVKIDQSHKNLIEADYVEFNVITGDIEFLKSKKDDVGFITINKTNIVSYL